MICQWLFPSPRKAGYIRLAVTTPWSVELNQYILLIVKNDLVVVLGNDNGNWTILLFRNRLRLDAWINLTSNKLVNEFANCFSSKLVGLVKRKFLVLDCLLNSESGPLANLEVEVATVLSEGLCVNGGEVDLALVLLCNLFKILGEGLALFWGFGEDVCKWKAGLY